MNNNETEKPPFDRAAAMREQILAILEAEAKASQSRGAVLEEVTAFELGEELTEAHELGHESGYNEGLNDGFNSGIRASESEHALEAEAEGNAEPEDGEPEA